MYTLTKILFTYMMCVRKGVPLCKSSSSEAFSDTISVLLTYTFACRRAESITTRTSTLVDKDDGEPHVGTWKGNALAEKYEKLAWTRPKDTRWQTSRKCEVAYALHEDLAQTGVRVETTHTVKVDNGKTVYVLEEHVSGTGVSATLTDRIGEAWKETLEKAVLSMGDAIVQRAVFVNGKPSSQGQHRFSLFK